MTTSRDELLAANAAFARSFTPRRLPRTPARRLAVLTCMDARMDPAAFLGLREGDAHVIRNAGGRASGDAVRSLLISHKLLGTDQWLVIHHTDCGQETYSGETMRRLCAPRSREAEAIDWLTIADREQAVVDDVRRLRLHPLVPPEVAIHGFLYDLATGRLAEVETASRTGPAEAGAEEPVSASPTSPA